MLRRDERQLVMTSERSSLGTSSGIDWTGDRLIVGLTPPEIDRIHVRIAALLSRVDRDQIPLF